MTTKSFNRFADWCEHKDDLSPEARQTVEVSNRPDIKKLAQDIITSQ